MNIACQGQQRWHDEPFFGCGHAGRQKVPHTTTMLTAPDTSQVFRTHHNFGTVAHLPPQYPMTQGTLRRVVRRLDSIDECEQKQRYLPTQQFAARPRSLGAAAHGPALRGGQLHPLTRDHTLVRELVDRGVVRPEEAANHPFRHVLTRALGGGGGEIEAEVQRVSLADEDQLLLCTDGLTDMVDSTTIGVILRSSASSKDACQTLVELALQNGGKDNVTVVLARYRIAHEP
jgi:hypothetical protein